MPELKPGEARILFVDVDGVLNNQQTFARNLHETDPIDMAMLERVKRIIAETGCKIVLSSTWRLNDRSLKKVQSFLPILDITPDKGNSSRGSEIEDWLTRQSLKSNFWVSRYAILDDSNDMLEGQQPNFFRTDWLIGLTDDIADRVITHLNS